MNQKQVPDVLVLCGRCSLKRTAPMAGRVGWLGMRCAGLASLAKLGRKPREHLV